MKPKRREPWIRTDADADMRLPEGETCGTCGHFLRCRALVGRIEADEVCDWAPSRFQAVRLREEGRK